MRFLDKIRIRMQDEKLGFSTKISFLSVFTPTGGIIRPISLSLGIVLSPKDWCKFVPRAVSFVSLEKCIRIWN